MILITGGKGYIGRNLSIANSQSIDREIEITELHQQERGQVEGIIHLAAISRVRHCEEDPVNASKTNVVGVTSMLELARRSNSWVVYISSIEAKEKRNIYGLTKWFGEELCRYYSERYGLRIVVLRLGDVIGKDNHPTKAIPKIDRLIKAGKNVILHNPKQLFHLLHIHTVNITLQNLVKELKVVHKSKSKIIVKEN